VQGADGTAELLDGWVPALALAGWRLHRQPQYTDAMLALGTLAWAHKAPMPAAAAGTSLWAYSVKLGTQLLAMPAMTERARRFRLFVEEVGGSLPPGVDAPTAMRHALQALWRLPMPNSLKQPFWYCFLDAIPTAARLHTRRPCGCGVSRAFPDRRHHFADCPVAQAVATTVTQNHPPRVGANVLADLRTLTPPPGIHAGIWSLVSLAAVYAMEAGRRRLSSRILQGEARRGAALAADVSAFAIESFWSVLAAASRAPLPFAWRTQAPAPHPFLGWDAASARWAVRRLPP